MDRLNEGEIFERWYQNNARGKVNKKDAKILFKSVFDEIVNSVREDKKVVINKFGTFYPQEFKRSNFKSYLVDDYPQELDIKIMRFSKATSLKL